PMTAQPGRIVPIVLARGTGTWLWPMSRAARPKQFLALVGENTLFQDTLLRLDRDPRYAAPIVVTNEDYRFLVAEQAQEAGVSLAAILLEPVQRNTAPAIAAAALFALADGLGRLVHVLPSDHRIRADDAYARALDIAEAAAGDGALVTFGIRPTEPATGFGYIEAGEALASGAHAVNRFVEKPGRAEAEAMLASGGYFWNSGMFLFDAAVFLEECERLAGDVLAAARAALAAARADLDFLRLDRPAFEAAPDISVDYAIFEKTARAAVVPADIAWSDLGSWDAVWKHGERDAAGNLARGPAM